MDGKGETPSVLETTAPGFFHVLRRSFPASVVAELGRLYEVAVAASGLEAPSVPRAPQASFNPRPARVGRILLTDGEAPAETIGTALASFPGQGLTPKSPLIDLETVAEVHAACGSTETRLSIAGEGIVLSFILDEVRHLHISNLDQAARIATIKRARLRVEQIRSTERWRRLLTLVGHALSRWE